MNECILSNSKKCIDVIVNNGANINYESNSISTALKLKNLELVQYLVEEKKCNIHKYKINNILPLDGSNALISFAAAFSSPQIIDYLVSKGLDIHANSGHAFCWACSHGELENAQHILKTYNCNINRINTISGETPLSWSVTCEKLDIVEFLLEQNVVIDLYTLDHLISVEKTTTFLLFKDKLTNEHIEYLINKLNEDNNNSPINSFVLNLSLEKKLSHSFSKSKKNKNIMI